MKELITIIVPIYKVEGYLQRCINSILKQTYSNLEIILVDDGSPDNCGKICDEYAIQDERIKVIHKENGGLSDARNAGIDIANGDYITFVDSDDWIHTQYIEKLYSLLVKTNSDISICNFTKTNTENVQIDNCKEDVLEFTNLEALEQFYDKFSVQIVVAWGKLYKKCLFKNIRFPIGRIHEDEFTTYKLLYKANKIALTTNPLLYYWQREDSIMGSGYNIKHRLDAIDALAERAEFFYDAELKELSSKTYKTVFLMILDIAMRVKKINAVFNKHEFEKLRKNLRNSNQKISFKIFYELYFVSPIIVKCSMRMYKKIMHK